MRRVSLLLTALVMLSCNPKSRDVRIELPIPPKMDLSNYNSVYFPGFLVVDKNKEFKTNKEAINFFKRDFINRDAIAVRENDPVDLVGKDARDFLERVQPFFTTMPIEDREHTLAITGLLSFETVDRSGFREVSLQDRTGRSYRRTQFVEATGYVLNVRVYIYAMGTGKLLYREILRDGIDLAGVPNDTRLVFYELAGRVSNRLVSLFASTNVKAERSLL